MGIKTLLARVSISLRSSFWFVPALMILAAAILAGSMVELDGRAGIHLTDKFPRVFGANAQGARNILSSIASSMISIAGVTFSITIVALSLASAQYTSRILRNFMRDRANQIVLGVFVSIFVYCLIVLRSIRGGEESFIPSLSLAMGLLLGVIGIGFLIFFIHHVATSIQASTIISRIAHDTLNVIDELYTEKHSGEEEDSAAAESYIQASSWMEILSSYMGYMQNMDVDGLMEWAENNHTIVRMLRGIGEFVLEDKPLFAVACDGAVQEEFVAELNAFIGTASFRTIEQDPAFGVRQLVDISLKALSPGVNDTTSAVTCLSYLGAILGRVGMRKIPGEVCRRNGKVRLITRTQTYQYFVDEALSQIRQDARGNVAVHLAMLETIESAIHPGLSRGRRKILQNHLARIKRVVREHVKDPDDQEAIRERFQKVEGMLSPTVVIG